MKKQLFFLMLFVSFNIHTTSGFFLETLSQYGFQSLFSQKSLKDKVPFLVTGFLLFVGGYAIGKYDLFSKKNSLKPNDNKVVPIYYQDETIEKPFQNLIKVVNTQLNQINLKNILMFWKKKKEIVLKKITSPPDEQVETLFYALRTSTDRYIEKINKDIFPTYKNQATKPILLVMRPGVNYSMFSPINPEVYEGTKAIQFVFHPTKHNIITPRDQQKNITNLIKLIE